MTDPITIARAQAAIENGLIDALRSQQQADMDGTTVIVSRQACDEAAEFLPALYDEVKRLRLRAAHAEHTTDAAISEVRRLEAERDALRAALEWYGEQARLARLVHSGGDAGRHALANDGGNRARAALKGDDND